ncbi:RagB/SusD family nutrient uptake outer membrane protein [Chitinophagaceae bacterium LWZ2-11]
MKNIKKNILKSITGALIVAAIMPACSKVLDKKPITQVVMPNDSSTISASDAENVIAGCYTNYRGYDFGLEVNVLDRITNGDAISDNCYAGGDNSDNITLDLFTANSLNGNVARDWKDLYGIIGRANIAIDQVQKCVDPALTAVRKNQILGEARFMRAFCYFDLVRLYGNVPLLLKPADLTSAQTLLNSTIVPQVPADSVYGAILNDLWFAKNTVRPAASLPTKFLVSTGAVNATLAKVYASRATPNWDSVLYYCNATIPDYSMVTNYTFLWDNNHKNNSEAIWELNYEGYSVIGNWIPSQFLGADWKKFNTPTNDLVNTFRTEGDSIRLHSSISFLNMTGHWTDKYWNVASYPFLAKYNDPVNGTNDFYVIRLPDILLLKAEALVEKSDLPGAMALVNQVRARVSLGTKAATTADDARTAIAVERRLELAFEGHRWYDLLRTGKALTTMNAQKDGNGNNLNYGVTPNRLLLPIPQAQIDLNPLLKQNTGY